MNLWVIIPKREIKYPDYFLNIRKSLPGRKPYQWKYFESINYNNSGFWYKNKFLRKIWSINRRSV